MGLMQIRNFGRFGLILLMCAFWSLTALGQGTISGKVTDSKTGEPLPFCNVFINTTTFVTTTDFDGQYVLKGIPEGDFEIGFSFIGYQAVQKPVAVRDGGSLTVNTVLVSTEQELSDVEIKAKRDKVWERELRKFKNLFLGNDYLAANCEILNPWVIDFPEDNSNSSFKAAAIQPIQIRNEALGYLLTFDLKDFLFTPQTYLISGATRFEQLEAPDAKTKLMWEKNRADAYLKSTTNLFKSILENKHNQQGFYLYGDKPGGSESRNIRSNMFADELGKSVIPYKPDNFVTPARKLGEYRILIQGRVEIHYEKGYSTVNTYKDAPYPISWVESKSNYVLVNTNGTILNPKDVVFSGDMDKRKVASLLPLDYKLEAAYSDVQLAKDANGLQEKVYLQFDRPYYYQGDQAFFKAYLRYPSPDMKREMSQVLYVELINKERDILFQKKFKIENGQAVGDFLLPLSLTEKEYYIRSYTSWIRNYGPDFYFIRPFPVLSTTDRILTGQEQALQEISKSVTVSTEKEAYGKRELVKLQLSVTNDEGRPVSANLSVSVTDAAYVTPLQVEPSIHSSLALVSVPTSLTTEKFSYPLEKNLEIKGRFLNEKDKPAPTAFTLFFNGFQDLLEMETDKEGNFVLEDTEFYGQLDFGFLALDKKGRNYGKFELTPRLNPPFSIPTKFSYPKWAGGNPPIFNQTENDVPFEVELDQVVVEEKNKGPQALYGKPDHVVKGEDLMRGGNTADLLLSLKQYIPGMMVNSFGQVTIRGGATSAQLSMEPMVMLNGAILPGNSAASNINSINPNDVDRVEVVSRISSIMGDMGRNGIISIYLKQGMRPEPPPSLKVGMTNLNLEGFSLPNNFFQLDYETAELLPSVDERATLYWNPYLVSDSETGLVQIQFYTNDSNSPKYLVVEGVSIDGTPIRGTYLIGSVK
jgi:hypothetical protein